MKKLGKTTWPFRFHLIKSLMIILYSGSDKKIPGVRSDRVLEELKMEVHDIVQQAVIKIPKKKKYKKAKKVL